MTGLPLRQGSAGEAVADLQRRLAGLGLLDGAASDPPATFAAGTTEAVRTFQGRYGLDVDGVVSELTWSILVEAGYELGDRQLYLRAPMMRGDDIADLQGRLGALGFDAGRADGIFGPQTAAALTEFQRNAGVSCDGICGPDTVTALHRLGHQRTAAVMVNQVRERERLRSVPPSLSGRRLAIGHAGGLAALTQALHRRLRDAGAVVLTLHHPDGSAQARMANTFDADVLLALRVSATPANRTAYFRGVNFSSQPGSVLAELIGRQVSALTECPPDVVGMRLPLLRETRMPAVIAELGPAPTIVAGNEQVSGALVAALAEWAAEPVKLPSSPAASIAR
jgi:N-acetylmuramoyl-L-alanine amidase